MLHLEKLYKGSFILKEDTLTRNGNPMKRMQFVSELGTTQTFSIFSVIYPGNIDVNRLLSEAYFQAFNRPLSTNSTEFKEQVSKIHVAIKFTKVSRFYRVPTYIKIIGEIN